MKIKNIKSTLHWPWQVKTSPTDAMYSYRFDIFDFQKIGYIFLISAIVAPILMDAVVRLAFINSHVSANFLNYVNVIRNFLRFIFILLGFVYINARKSRELLQTGSMAFYFYIFITQLVGFIASLLLTAVGQLSGNINVSVQLIINIFADGSALVCCFVYIPRFKLLLKSTWINNRMTYLWLLPIFIGIGIGLNIFAGYLQNLAHPGVSDNQSALNKGYHIWYNAILLIIFTIGIAPFIEEFATRHGIFQLCGNKTIGFIASFCFFAQMHITSANDWEHLIAYLGGALALTTTFTVFRYNVWASAGVHVGINTTTVIITLINNNH